MTKALTLIFTIFITHSHTHANRFTAMAEKYKQAPQTYYQQHLPQNVYTICREKGTERAYSHPYDKLFEAGTYMCRCCGGDFPLYKSDTKYDSKTGWPSFWAPIEGHVSFAEDTSGIIGFFSSRTEVLCARCGSHLGHVFDDGPQDKGGKRYCMNGLALHFVKEGDTPTRLFQEPQ